jgi:HEAT repeat protein
VNEVALFGVIVLLGLALVTCLLVILIGRMTRSMLDRRRAIRERRLRPQLLSLLAADPHDLPAELDLHHGDLDALADLAGPFLRKVRGDARERLAAQLHQRGVVEQARHRMDARNAVHRARAAAFLGNVGDEESVGRLCAMLHDPHPDVPAAAARALGRIGRAEAAPSLLSTLGGEPRAPDTVPAGTVVAALMALGTTAAPAALEAAVTARGTRQTMAIETLGLLAHVPAADALIGLLAIDTTSPMEVRTRSARALGRIGSPKAVPFLAGILGGDDPWPLRAVSAKALGDIGAANAVDALEALLGDPEAAVVVNVARAMASTAEGRARLAPLAATAPPAGIIPRDEWATYQPAVAAAEALAAAGVPVVPPAAPSGPTVDLRAEPLTLDDANAGTGTTAGTDLDPASDTEELTMWSPAGRDGHA